MQPTFLQHTVPNANSAKAERASLYTLLLDPSTGVLFFPSYWSLMDWHVSHPDTWPDLATFSQKPTLSLDVNVMYLSIPKPEANKHSRGYPHLPGFL